MKELDKKAFDTLKKQAESGDASAQYTLANEYRKKAALAAQILYDEQTKQYSFSLDDSKKWYSEAFFWYRKSAEQNHSDAELLLGELYRLGEGIAKNIVESVRWYEKSAIQGNAGAQYALGELYRIGEEVPKDISKAIYWYNKAAALGNSNAQFKLGNMHESGQETKLDFSEVLQYYTQAANRGHAGAQFRLGMLYKQGKGVEKNPEQSEIWFKKAFENGYPDSRPRTADGVLLNELGIELGFEGATLSEEEKKVYCQ